MVVVEQSGVTLLLLLKATVYLTCSEPGILHASMQACWANNDVVSQASALSSKVSLLMIKYDLEHSGSGKGGMSVPEAIECAPMPVSAYLGLPALLLRVY